MTQTLKNPPAIKGDPGSFPGSVRLPEKGMATHSSIAWRVAWTEEPMGYSPWGHKELDTTERLSLSLFMESRKMAPMSLIAGQEWRFRYREQAVEHSREKRGWNKLRK